MGKRLWAVLTVLVVGSLWLAGCGPAKPAAPAAGGDVTDLGGREIILSLIHI